MPNRTLPSIEVQSWHRELASTYAEVTSSAISSGSNEALGLAIFPRVTRHAVLLALIGLISSRTARKTVCAWRPRIAVVPFGAFLILILRRALRAVISGGTLNARGLERH